MACKECIRLTKLFEAAVRANAKIGDGKVNVSPEIDRAKAQFNEHYTNHQKTLSSSAVC